MINLLNKFERFIVISLIFMMLLVVVLLTIELGWIIISNIITPPIILLKINEILEIFGFFLLVLIGIELLEILKAYLIENAIHAEIVLEVALIAIARKVIILDVNKHSSSTLLGIAALIIAVSLGVFVIKRKYQARTDNV